MIDSRKTPITESQAPLGKQRSYSEVVEYLNAHWQDRSEKNLSTISQLDKALGNIAKKINAVLVTGTNGKSLTINFATQLLRAEGLKVGSFYSPHILTYNERLSLDNETISNKTFTEIANEVINAAETHNIPADSLEILTMMALLHFKNNDVDIAFLESKTSSISDPVNICHPNILAITRITSDQNKPEDPITQQMIDEIIEMVKPDTHVVSADQSKLSLQVIQEKVKEVDGIWGMPIRKLAPLEYPYEQLHGRCAALAERICHIYVDNFAQKDTIIASNSLLAKEQGKRGRPTLEAKRQAELNPKKTVDQFWKETINTLSGRFQLLDKEKPTILLDNASNIDALKNLLLGIRLLHYQRPLKGITFIFGCDKNNMYSDEFLRSLRYFTKKNSGQVIFCPIKNNLPGLGEESWDVEQITNNIKSMKIKAKAFQNFKEAFEYAKETVDERHGLVVISGSKSIISEYWNYKGIKKL